MAPENISPLVVWLGSAESRDVTGRVFEVKGGMASAAPPTAGATVPKIDKGARWEPDEVGAAVHELLEKAVPVPRRSTEPDPRRGREGRRKQGA